ncbi:MAG: hypothetical protein AB7U51_13785 [Arcobacter sp.]|uniref:hypothetical protein n=1 Tax=Arcobacter sp. TaxID=1872629 RepID=UPI003CFD797B
MRKITNFISPILKNYRYRNKPDPFLEFKKLRVNEIMPISTNGNVLILPIRVSPISNLFEGLCGYALKLRGYSVHSLFCGQAIEKCDNQTILKNNPLNCSLCYYEQKRFIDTFDIVPHYYFDFLNSELINKIDDLILKNSTKNLLELNYDDINLGNQITMAVIRHLLSSKIDLVKHEKIIREFAFSTIVSYEVTKKLIKKLKPKFVLLSHGVYSTWGGAIESCKKEKTKIIVWGRGYVKGNILADFDDSYIFECAKESNALWENLNLSSGQKEKLYAYFKDKKNPLKTSDYVTYYKNISDNTFDYEKYPFLKNKERIKFGLFPNIPWDGTTFSASKEFSSLDKFLKETIGWFLENKEYDLIIRAHPAEIADKQNLSQERIKDLIDELLPILPENIFYIEPDDKLTSYNVSDICDANLFFASTMALEFAFENKIVIQTGQSMISNKGFVFEAKNVEEYKSLLNKASKKELIMTDDMKQRVEKYAYHWIYKRHIPENTYEHKALTFTKYNFNSSMELAPGKNKVVDWFIDRCEDGKPFIWEE